MRPEAWTASLGALLLAGCALTPGFWRPQGSGGWSEERRADEVGRLARKAGVDLAASTPAPAATTAPTERTTIDLPTALAMAAKGSRRIAQADRDVDARGQRVRFARAGMLPNLSGSGRYTWYSDPLTNPISSQFLPPSAAGSAPPSITIRKDEVGTLNGTVTLPIDLSGELRHALAAAQAGYRGEQARAWATTIDRELAVVRAYFGVLEAKRLREVADQNVALYRQQLGDAESKFDAGRLTKNEVLVVRVTLQDAEQEGRRLDVRLAQARYALNDEIGADVNAPTEPADVDAAPTVPAVAEALQATYAENPMLRSLVEEQQRLEETAVSLARKRLPRFSAGGAIDYTSVGPVEPRDVGSGFVGFTWLLDDRDNAEVAETRIAADRNRLEIERQLRELESLVRSTHQSAEERLTALAAAESSVEQAEENLRIRRQQFDVGRATSDDVLDAQALLSRQRAERATALYQAHVRLAELRGLMGMTPR